VNFFRKIKKHRSHRWTLVAPWYVTVSHRCSRPLHATVGPHPLTPPHAPRWHHHIHHERERGIPGSVATSATTTREREGEGTWIRRRHRSHGSVRRCCTSRICWCRCPHHPHPHESVATGSHRHGDGARSPVAGYLGPPRRSHRTSPRRRSSPMR
jgi:hypothetical protein